MRRLSEVSSGQEVLVRQVGGEGAVRRRIMEMGITRGIRVAVIKLAPLGDPMQLRVRGYQLSLRKADAELIEVDEL